MIEVCLKEKDGTVLRRIGYGTFNQIVRGVQFSYGRLVCDCSNAYYEFMDGNSGRTCSVAFNPSDVRRVIVLHEHTNRYSMIVKTDSVTVRMPIKKNALKPFI